MEKFGIHLCRVENVAGSGIPDVNACWRGVEIWIELKMFRGNQLHFRCSQLGWISKRIVAGGHVAVLARKNDEVWVFDGTTIAKLAQAEAFSRQIDGGVVVTPTAEHAAGVFAKPLDWEGIRAILFAEKL